MHSFVLGLHFTGIVRDRVSLVYALMTTAEVNIGVVYNSSMRKGQVYRYAFGGLITELCKRASVQVSRCSKGVPRLLSPNLGIPLLCHQHKGTRCLLGTCIDHLGEGASG